MEESKERAVTLSEILQDIHACEEDILIYERKYQTPSETFYAAYRAGEEPPDHISVHEWNDWAGAYEIRLRRYKQYEVAVWSSGAIRNLTGTDYDNC